MWLPGRDNELDALTVPLVKGILAGQRKGDRLGGKHPRVDKNLGTRTGADGRALGCAHLGIAEAHAHHRGTRAVHIDAHTGVVINFHGGRRCGHHEIARGTIEAVYVEGAHPRAHRGSRRERGKFRLGAIGEAQIGAARHFHFRGAILVHPDGVTGEHERVDGRVGPVSVAASLYEQSAGIVAHAGVKHVLAESSPRREQERRRRRHRAFRVKHGLILLRTPFTGAV